MRLGDEVVGVFVRFSCRFKHYQKIFVTVIWEKNYLFILRAGFGKTYIWFMRWVVSKRALS
jgi:ERCC4-related helicase